MSAESLKQELEEEAKEYGSLKVFDFDSSNNFLFLRATKWADYQLSKYTEEDWKALLIHALVSGETWVDNVFITYDLFLEERSLIHTNKPYAYQALFFERVINRFIFGAQIAGYLSSYDFTEKGLALIGHSKQTTPVATDEEEEVEENKSEEDEDSEVDTGQILQQSHEADTEGIPIPDFRNIRAIANKDKELFPDPQPIRAEVAGTTINFTTWDAALVVYLDCSFERRNISLQLLDILVATGVRTQDISQIVPVVERTVGEVIVCAAIFPRIPLVNDDLRSLETVVTQTECRVSGFKEDLPDEKVTLIRGQVTELDWRESIADAELPSSQRERLGRFVGPHGELYEYKIMAEGETKGEYTAKAHYPSAAIRDQQGINALAEYSFQIWFRSQKAQEQERKNWELSATEGKRLYMAAFIAAYTKEIAKKDREAGITPTTLTTITTGTPSNTATLQGATITLKDVKHNADECVYFLEVVDPNYIDGAYEEKWVLRLEDSTMPDTSTAASSSYGAFANSSSDLIPLPENRSKSQQKPKKVISSNFRKPQ